VTNYRFPTCDVHIQGSDSVSFECRHFKKLPNVSRLRFVSPSSRLSSGRLIPVHRLMIGIFCDLFIFQRSVYFATVYLDLTASIIPSCRP
jgi:hypothetical protein